MKKQSFMAALLCLVLLLGAALAGCAPVGPVVAKVGDEVITASDLNLYANFLLMQDGLTIDGITDPAELQEIYDYSLDIAVMFKVLFKKGMEKKLYPLSEADRKEVDSTVSQYLDNELQTLKQGYQDEQVTNPAIDPDKEARKALNDRMQKTGLNRETLTTLMRQSKVAQLLMDEAMKDVAVSDEELKTGYDTKVAEQKEEFTADTGLYEEAQANGYPAVLYKPAGFRYVKHILIALPEDVNTQITEALNNGEEDKANQLRDEGLQGIKAKADEVLSKVNAGGDFDSLMAEYGEDPGMQQEPASKTGYELGSETMFIEEFKAAALKLGKIGDVTGLVATEYGYHIIKWVGDVPSGPIPLEEVKDALTQELLEEKQNTAWDAYLKQLKAEYKVEEYPDKIPARSPSATLEPT